MTREIIEYNHDMGYLPDRYYYQMNGKSANENYREIANRRFRISKKKSSLEDIVFSLLQAMLETALKEAMKNILPKK